MPVYNRRLSASQRGWLWASEKNCQHTDSISRCSWHWGAQWQKAGAALGGTWLWEQAMAVLCLNGGIGEVSEGETCFDILWSRKDKTLQGKHTAKAAAAPAFVCLVSLPRRWVGVKGKKHWCTEGKVNIAVNDEATCDWSFSVELLAKSGESLCFGEAEELVVWNARSRS